MNRFQNDFENFLAENPYREADIDGTVYRYILTGKEGNPAIVAFNGLEMQEMWIKYAEALPDGYQFLILQYPVTLKTNCAQAKALHALLKKMKIQHPILCGASDGGIHAHMNLKLNYIRKGDTKSRSKCLLCGTGYHGKRVYTLD